FGTPLGGIRARRDAEPRRVHLTHHPNSRTPPMLARTVAALLAILLAIPLRGEEPGVKVRLEDHFATDSLGEYRKKGDVSWQKGKLVLRDGGVLRRIPLGYRAGVEATIRWPRGTRDGLLQIYLLSAQGRAATGIGLEDGRRILLLVSNN